MGIFKSNKKQPIKKEYFKPSDKFLTFSTGIMVEVALYDNYLSMKAPFSKDKTIYTIDYTQITDVYYGIETEIVKSSKSPISRAVIGGLLFGETGAVVGAISGVGEKEKKNYIRKFIISYMSSDGQEKFLNFDDTCTALFNGEKFSKKLKELANIKEPEKKINKTPTKIKL